MRVDTDQLRRILRDKNIPQGALAKEAGYMPLSYLSALLRGWQRLTPKAAQRLQAGLKALGLSDADIAHVFTNTIDTNVQSRND